MPTTIDAAYPYAGAGSGIVTHAQWMAAIHYFGCTDGVGQYGPNIGNSFEVFADSTGLQVKVKSGECWIQGGYGYEASETTLAVGGTMPSSGQERIALIILRNKFTDKRIELDVLPGTNMASASVVPDALTQNATIWEIPLAQVRLTSTTGATIAPGAVTDARLFARARGVVKPGHYTWTSVDNAFGMLPPDGAAVSRVTYAELFAEIGTFYGVGDGVYTFNVPDKRGEVLAFKDGGAGRLAGMDGHAAHYGAQTHPLTTAELAAHSHAMPHTHDLDHNHAGTDLLAPGGAGFPRTNVPASVANPTGGVSTPNTANAGSGTAHNNVQPTGMAWLWIAARPI